LVWKKCWGWRNPAENHVRNILIFQEFCWI
jgi:hypothetical protein